MNVNAELDKNFVLVKSLIDSVDAELLVAYIKYKFSDKDSQIELPLDPSQWDRHGIISRIITLSKTSTKRAYSLSGALKLHSVRLLKTTESTEHHEKYFESKSAKKSFYTVVVTPSSPLDYKAGETLYVNSGEGLRPNFRDAIVHLNSEPNSWKICSTEHGTRFDLVVVLETDF